MKFDLKTINIVIVIVLGVTFTATLFLPTMYWGSEEPMMLGGEVFLWGWGALFGGQAAWLANFLFPTCLLVALNYEKPSLILNGLFGVLLIMFAVHANGYTHVHTPDGRYPVTRGIGYTLWVGVIGITGVWLIALAMIRRIQLWLEYH